MHTSMESLLVCILIPHTGMRCIDRLVYCSDLEKHLGSMGRTLLLPVQVKLGLLLEGFALIS